MWGAELYWYGTEPATREINRVILECGGEAGLRFTFGSDDHGPGSEHDTLGRFEGEFEGFE